MHFRIADTFTVCLSTVTLAERLFGIAALPSGRRKDALSQTRSGLLELFADRVPAFDAEPAWRYAELAATSPFPRPETGRFAVKVINHLGDEVMKVFRVG